ncbi:MAG: DUF433 domain-containing protein [Vicinamibacterales bacterium]
MESADAQGHSGHPWWQCHRGKPCIRGTRVTVVGLVAAGHTSEEILREHPYVEAADIGRSPVLFGVACRGG